MKEFKAESLVNNKLDISDIDYKIINSLNDFDDISKCIIIKTLNPDYYLLFGSIKLIITENGSALSHLAIVARENNLGFF